MNRPPTKTLVMGHPVVATPLSLMGGVMLFAAFKGSSLFVALLAIAMLLTVRRAYEEASAYRAWKREWDGLAPAAPRTRQPTPAWVGIAFLGIVAIAALWWFGGEPIPTAAWHVGIAAGCLYLLAVMVAAVRWLTRRRRSGSFTVTVMARPVVPVPALADAYRTLPPHCRVLLGASQ